MKKYFQHYFPLFLIMGCIGLTVEIFFTAIYDRLTQTNLDFSLKGHSYIWMFPLYGLTALAFPPLIKVLSHFRWWGRALIMGLGILVIEYIAGACLRFLTGNCPWEYREGFHIHGLIRLDYYPLWVLFAGGIEAAIRWLHPRLTMSINLDTEDKL